RTTYAARGQMAFNTARTDLFLTLYDGVVHEAQSDRMGGFQRLYFEQQIVPLRNVGNELQRRLGGSDRSDREVGFAQLARNARERRAQLDSMVAASRAEAVAAVQTALALPPEDPAADSIAAEGGPRPRTLGILARDEVT